MFIYIINIPVSVIDLYKGKLVKSLYPSSMRGDYSNGNYLGQVARGWYKLDEYIIPRIILRLIFVIIAQVLTRPENIPNQP